VEAARRQEMQDVRKPLVPKEYDEGCDAWLVGKCLVPVTSHATQQGHGDT